MAKDPIKKADNGTYYFRANLGYNPITGKQIQKYRCGFKTKKEAREEYSKLVLTSIEELTPKRKRFLFRRSLKEPTSAVQDAGKGKHLPKPPFHRSEAFRILVQNGNGRDRAYQHTELATETCKGVQL